MKFILFHGAFGNPDENWFPMLASKLREIDQEVVIPTFPVDDWDQMVKNGPDVELKNQSLVHWLESFEKIMQTLDKKDKLCFIGHSIACVFMLHVVQKYDLYLDSAIFVSPFFGPLDRWEFNLANHTFYKNNFDKNDLLRRIPISYVLYSDNDPYVRTEYMVEFGKFMQSSCIIVPGGGHLNQRAGFSSFPLIEELAKLRCR